MHWESPPTALSAEARQRAGPGWVRARSKRKPGAWAPPGTQPLVRATLAHVMVAAAPLYEPVVDAGEQHFLLGDVPWHVYVMLRDTLDTPGLRMTYLEGWLEIMSPSRTHEVNKKQIARFLELFCLERDIPLFGYGSTTFRSEEAERGLEPDECYCRGQDRDVPDIALEVIHTPTKLDKLHVYRGLGVREVWIFRNGAFDLFALRGETYEALETSEIIPELDLARLAHFAEDPNQPVALRAYRDELRRAKP